MVCDEVEWEEGGWRRKEARLTFCVGVAVLVGWRGLVVGSRTKRSLRRLFFGIIHSERRHFKKGDHCERGHCLWGWIIQIISNSRK